MLHFYQAVAQLMEHIRGAKAHDVRFTQPLADKPPFALIDWLDAQPIFPKFYWQSRDTREEVVALGQVYTFTDPAPAYAILGDEQQYGVDAPLMGIPPKIRVVCLPSSFYHRLN